MIGELTAKLEAMPTNTFYPSREALVYAERHSAAGGGGYWTIWADGMPYAVNLDDASTAALEYEYAREKLGVGEEE